jgi:DNA-binding response OmpR family regulator
MNDKVKVLVVDDEEIVCASVKRILSREGYEVDAALTAADGLDRVAGERYHLVITDLMMPEMNGIELMHAMRKQGQDMPFLMITGYPTIRTAMQALRLGAVDYVPKPFTRKELISPVNRALRRKEAREVAGEPGQKSSDQPMDIGARLVLPEHSWAVYEQDGAVAVGVIESFLDSAGTVVELHVPGANEMIEQGHPTIKLLTDDGNEHGVFSPISGRVMAVNQELVEAPSRLGPDSWVLRIVPSNLKAEAMMLVRQDT